MNNAEIIAAIEEHYDAGQYREYDIQIINKYLDSRKFDAEEFLMRLFTGYSTVYKTLPDIAKMVEIMDDVSTIDTIAEKAWMSIMDRSGLMSLVCTDPVLQLTIQSMGGWFEFTSFRDNKNTFCHKDFMARYKSLFGSVADPRVLLGYYDNMSSFPVNYNKVRIIGDQEIGMKMLESLKSQGEITGRTGEPKKLDFNNLIKDINDKIV